jgi:hypothetical protein
MNKYAQLLAQDTANKVEALLSDPDKVAFALSLIADRLASGEHEAKTSGFGALIEGGDPEAIGKYILQEITKELFWDAAQEAA